MNSGDRELNSNYLVNYKVSGFRKLCLLLNTFYPLGWVLIFQTIALLLMVNDWLQVQLLWLYHEILEFSSINKSPPFSTSFGQAYAMALVFLMPVQFISLSVLSESDISGTVTRKFERGNMMPSMFFGGCFLVLFFFLPLSDISLVRLLGGGAFAVSVITPVITSLLPLSIRLLQINLRRNHSNLNEAQGK